MPWSLSTNPSKMAATERNNSIECWITNKKVTCPGAIQIYHETKKEKGRGKASDKWRKCLGKILSESKWKE